MSNEQDETLVDHDGVASVDDGGGAPDGSGHCPALTNPHQLDHDADGLGDACELEPA